MKISNYFFAIIAVLCLFSCTKKKNNQYSIDTHLYENINIDDENWDETDEEDERYFGEWKDEEEDDCAEFAAANILEGFKGLARRIDSLDELEEELE